MAAKGRADAWIGTRSGRQSPVTPTRTSGLRPSMSSRNEYNPGPPVPPSVLSSSEGTGGQ
jgi:hypothetical protein